MWSELREKVATYNLKRENAKALTLKNIFFVIGISYIFLCAKENCAYFCISPSFLSNLLANDIS